MAMQFEFDVGPCSAILVKGNARLVDKLMRIQDPQSVNSAEYSMGLWDGLIHYFDRQRSILPAGLMSRLTKRLAKRGHTVKINYHPEPPKLQPAKADCLIGRSMDGDRAFQLDAVNAALEQHRGMWGLAVNAGKTSCIAAFAGELKRQANLATLIIVPNKNLVHQTGNEVAQLLGPAVRVGKVGDGIKQTDVDVMVGTFQSLAKALAERKTGCGIIKFLSKCGAVIADEGHRATSASHLKILESTPNAMYRIACSGSIDGSDKSQDKKNYYNVKANAHRWEMESRFGPILTTVTSADLVDVGISAKPKILLIEDREAFGPRVPTPVPIPGKPFMPQVVYMEVFEKAAVKDKRFRRSVCRIAAEFVKQGKPPLVFSHSVKQLTRLKKTFDKNNVKCILLTGKDGTRLRNQEMEMYAKSRDTIALVSSIFDEGYSLSAVAGVILAGARKNPRELIQRIGRGMRKKDEDNTITVVDFSMMHSTLLLKHYHTRCAEYRAQGFDVERIAKLSDIRSYKL